MRKLLFIDRDGTLCVEPEDKQVDRIDKVKLLDDVIPQLLRLKKAGYEFVLISNQDGLGTCSFPQDDFEIPHLFLMNLLASQGITFTEELICPHMPSEGCACRKPELGLVLKYMRDLTWDRQRSAVLGDRETDLLLADGMGIRGIQIAQDSKSDGISWEQAASTLLSEGRQSKIFRRSSETVISAEIDLERQGQGEIRTGLKFFDHMLEQLPKHGGFYMSLTCDGDLDIDDHHSIEDVGLVIGQCLREALGDKLGIQRYGFLLPMDESQAQVALDISGRPLFKFDGEFKREQIGALSTEMIPHFFRSFADALGANLHMQVTGENDHHQAEALFKGLARSLQQAVTSNKSGEVSSTKGIL